MPAALLSSGWRMAHISSECGTVRHAVYTRGTLIARDEPYEIYRNERIIHMTPSQAVVAYELVRFGRISRDRIFALALHAERGAVDSLAAVRILQIKEKLRAAGAQERITSIRGYGYELEIAP